jgi:hypothetical protein
VQACIQNCVNQQRYKMALAYFAIGFETMIQSQPDDQRAVVQRDAMARLVQ